jgi:hypothetical protein
MEDHPLNPPLQNSASPLQREPEANDLEKLSKWQEERIARKLRGEYESAILHLSELVSCHPLFDGAASDCMLLGQQQSHNPSENRVCPCGRGRTHASVILGVVD